MNIEEKTYQKITPATEGNYLTTYREGDDIKTYEGVKAMYTPADFDASSVREITPEEHLSYQKPKNRLCRRKQNREIMLNNIYMQERNVISGMLASWLTSFIEFVEPVKWFIVAALCLIIADFKFGIEASKKEAKPYGKAGRSDVLSIR